MPTPARKDKDESFTPPTAEQVRAHLEKHPPRGRPGWVAWLPPVALAAAVVMTFSAANLASVALPWLVLGGLFFALAWRVKRMRELEARVAQVQELAMLRRWVKSLRLAWRTLPALGTLPEAHGRTVAFVAHDLDQLKSFDAAIVAYDYLIDHLPPDHPGATQLRIQRAMAQLAGDRLTDADETLRRLRGQVEPIMKTPIGASYRLAGLIQQVRTNHYEEAAAQSGDLLEALRPLGVDAGYGHALLALSHLKLAESADPSVEAPAEASSGPTHREQARLWWSRATLLLSPAALVDRFADLTPLLTPPAASPPPSLASA